MYKFFHFDYARVSLRYLIRLYNITELYIPYYLCDVVRHSIILENCRPLFYHIDNNFMPVKNFPQDCYILYPNYFGVCNNNVSTLVKQYPKLIVDNAHAYYNPPQGFACFNSERKFLPVKNGSTLWIKKPNSTTDNENMQFVQNQRTEIFLELHKKYSVINRLDIDITQITSPFCYPCLLQTDDEADELAEKLTKEGKTIYRYWNPLPKSYNEYKFYRRLVPIPLD